LDSTYRVFCNNLEVSLDRFESQNSQEEDLLHRQIRQLRELIRLESEFRTGLSDEVFERFIRYITEERCNILSARPFFRERSAVFKAHISGGFKARSPSVIRQYRTNWFFVKWCVDAGLASPDGMVAEIAKIRQELAAESIPFAISQARIFWGKTPHSHLTFMDLVQIQAQGLLLATDKFVPPSDDTLLTAPERLRQWKSFRAVAIGIMRRDRVNAYSETSLHFYPQDRLKRYQANKLLRSHSGSEVDYNALAKAVNIKLAEDGGLVTTDAIELQDLLAAGSTVSADYNPDPDGESLTGNCPDSPDGQPDVIAERKQVVAALYGWASELPMLSRKILRMKGLRTVC
jgi:hypothetical protein